MSLFNLVLEVISEGKGSEEESHIGSSVEDVVGHSSYTLLEEGLTKALEHRVVHGRCLTHTEISWLHVFFLFFLASGRGEFDAIRVKRVGVLYRWVSEGREIDKRFCVRGERERESTRSIVECTRDSLFVFSSMRSYM